MKAWVLHKIGDFRLEEVEKPVLGKGEVLVRVMAAGVCGSDLPRIFETGAHRMPLIPGHEFSGIAEEAGENSDPKWVGKRVGVYPLIPCRKCAPCRAGHPEMCRDYDYLGSRRDGAFAEYVAVPERSLMELPEHVDFENAAMLEPAAVALHAIKLWPGYEEGKEKPIAVCGLGPIGLMLVMLLKGMGYHSIFVIGNKEQQRKRSLEIGIPEECFCDSRKEKVIEWLLEKTGGLAAFFECVGRQECISYGIDAAAPSSTVILVGNPASDMSLSRDVYWKILRNQLIVRGTWNSTFLPEEVDDDWKEAVRWMENGSFSPNRLITHRVTPEELGAELQRMRERTGDHCKVMLKQ